MFLPDYFHVFIPGVVVGGAGVPVKNIHKSVQILSVIIVVLSKLQNNYSKSILRLMIVFVY